MSTSNGGPAFPVGFGPDGSPDGVSDGMTLRDYFAAHAMAGIYSNPGRMGGPPEEVAGYAYAVADAMIAARGETDARASTGEG